MRKIKGETKLLYKYCHVINLVKSMCLVSALLNLRDKRPDENFWTLNCVIQHFWSSVARVDLSWFMSKHVSDMVSLTSMNLISGFFFENCVNQRLLMNLSLLDSDSKGQEIQSQGF